ncbi:hypothetical protein DNTS_004454 [Danionella cerebrum]|uniref:ETAA1 activator of ATR kinase n=1 Tax=Danionella cerebrum TaxID=2873325 RepID=A0A553PZC8_9TELE|nr:hypothetical protein DNTS_004454 [Danionella translucida]
MEVKFSEETSDRDEIAKLTQMKSKVNRLRRSPKATIINPGQILKSEFKTPTRPTRAQFRRLIPDDSPGNDPESHQDIVWDNTSPSPIRHGRVQRKTANVRTVDISDIANRIAPKSVRVAVADSSLLQWIGDSAIPCTPEVQSQKPKSVTSKQSTVDDLMRLAKQFDFNMRQDEALENDADKLRSENTEKQAHPNPFTPTHISSDTKSASLKRSEEESGFSQEMDDDLDLLFDGPTQQLSGRISQMCGEHTQDLPERNPLKCDSSSVTSEVKGDDFDDWSSDGLFEDSLLMEVTQNPHLFAAPQFSSTQKQTQHGNCAVTNKPHASDDITVHKSKQNEFKKQPQHSGGLQKIVNHTSQGFSNNKPSAIPQSQIKTNQSQQFHHVVPVKCVPDSPKPNPATSARHCSSKTKQDLTNIGKPVLSSVHQNPKPTEQRESAQNGFSAVLEDDLDSFFASDDIWDDGVEDDDLFYEACDNLEEVSGNPKRTTLQNRTKTPQSKTFCIQRPVFAHPHVPKRPADVSVSSANTSESLIGQKACAVSSRPSGFVSNASCDSIRPSGSSSNGAYKFKQVRSTTVLGQRTCNAPSQQGQERSVLAVLQSDARVSDNHQNSDSIRLGSGVNKDLLESAVSRCSDAEIESKKQQALERRRLRLLANQNLRAPF